MKSDLKKKKFTSIYSVQKKIINNLSHNRNQCVMSFVLVCFFINGGHTQFFYEFPVKKTP